jgi:hypothetical protein
VPIAASNTMTCKVIATLPTGLMAAMLGAGIAHADQPECVFDGWCSPDDAAAGGVLPGYYNENGQRCPDPDRPCVLDDINQ